MSNYKPRIESNNLDLTSILSTVNELPDAGPSVETCQLTITSGDPIPMSVYYCDGSASVQEVECSGTDVTVEVLKNSLVTSNATYVAVVSGNANFVVDGIRHGIFIAGDATVRLMS